MCGVTTSKHLPLMSRMTKLGTRATKMRVSPCALVRCAYLPAAKCLGSNEVEGKVRAASMLVRHSIGTVSRAMDSTVGGAAFGMQDRAHASAAGSTRLTNA